MSNYSFTNLDQSRIPFPVSACVSDVELSKCEYGMGENYEYIDFHYTRETDEGTALLKDRIFAIREENVSPASYIPGDTKEDALKREEGKLMKRLLHVATKFGITKDELQKLPTSSFSALAKAYCQLINDNCDGVKLYCKTVKDKNGYCKMSKYVPFLQKMGKECELSYNSYEITQLAANTPSNGAVKESRQVQDWV